MHITCRNPVKFIKNLVVLGFVNSDSANLISSISPKFKNIDINVIEGIGAGVLYPKSDVALLNYEENSNLDEKNRQPALP